MGTRTRSLLVIVAALALGVAGAAWADDAAAPPEAEQQVEGDLSLAWAGTLDPTVELGVTENAKGTVYYYCERRPEMWATIGLRHGLRPQAVVAILRSGEIVAQGYVKDVRAADCIISPAPGTPAGTVIVGDDVRVLMNGPREALNAKIRREHSDRILGSVAAFAILFGNIWAVRY